MFLFLHDTTTICQTALNRSEENKSNITQNLITCVTVNGENVVFITAKYCVCDSVSAVGLVAGFHLRNPSTLRKKRM